MLGKSKRHWYLSSLFKFHIVICTINDTKYSVSKRNIFTKLKKINYNTDQHKQEEDNPLHDDLPCNLRQSVRFQ